MEMNNEVLWLTPKDIEKRMQLSHGTINKLFHTKGFPAVRIGRTLRVRAKDFDEFMSNYISHTINI